MAIKVRLVNEPVFAKGFQQDAPLIKTNTENFDLIKSQAAKDTKAYHENPLRLIEAMNFKEKPTSLTFNILYQMSVKNDIVAAVLNTRINQVSTFTKPARFASDRVGYHITLRDSTKSPTKKQKKQMEALEIFLENCGYSDEPDRDNFDTFIRKFVRDSLTYDQACFEVVPDRKGYPAALYIVDASTIRAASAQYEGEIFGEKKIALPKSNEVIKWVQVINGAIVSWFTSSELAFAVRNPRSHIDLQPYGFSELEMLIHSITSHLYAEEYNSRYFTNGGTTKGIINIKSDPNGIGNREQLDSFKRQWRAQVNGMQGSWKTPVLQVPEGIEYITVNQSNRDMEFNQWLNYLTNIICAVYQIDPAEINFSNNGGAAAQSSVFETSQEQKLKHSKDKGLKPLLRFIESTINKYIISRFSQEFVFSFTGLDEKTEIEKAELYSKNVRVWQTINEIRKENGVEPIKNGDVILDSSWLNYNMQQAMSTQGSEEGAEGNEDYDDEGNYEGEQDSEEQPDDSEGNEDFNEDFNKNKNTPQY